MYQPPKRAYIYIDGSFNPSKNTYGSGIHIVFDNGETLEYSTKGDGAKLKNVTGEIMAALISLQIVSTRQIYDIIIYYDFDGIFTCLNQKNIKDSTVLEYVNFVKSLKKLGYSIEYIQVKSKQCRGNLRADKLAKEASKVD